MQHFYDQLNSQSEQSTYWQLLSVLRLAQFNVITNSNTFLAWLTW